MDNLQVLILAGGIGRRMWPIKRNKNMLPFFGRPLIVHQIESFQQAGFDDLMVVVNPQIKTAIEEEMKKRKIKVKTVVQKKPLGQANALLSAEKKLRKKPLLVVNANDFFRPDLFPQIKKKLREDYPAFTVAYQVKKYFPGGYLKVGDGQVSKIVEKPGQGKEPSDLVKLVFDFYREPERLLTAIKEVESRQIAYEAAMNRLIEKGVKFGWLKYQGPWVSIKYPWDILKMVEFFLREKKKEPAIRKKGVKMMKGAVVKNSFLGEGVVVGNNALIRDSIVEKNCLVGYNTEIARSYVGPGCWFHINYLGDSVLEEKINFGSGARAANFRLDEREIEVRKDGRKIKTGRRKLGAVVGPRVRVGVNASLMPGVLIGGDSFVGPGLVLGENLEEGQFCYVKQQMVVKKNLRKVTGK